jgi:DNA-binding beta-propeller fold protein YncE
VRRLGRRALAAAVVTFAFAASPTAAGELRYVQRLVLPTELELLGYPQAVTADPHTGEVFVCDTYGNRLVIFAPDGSLAHQIPGGRLFDSPFDVAIDPEGLLLLLAVHDGRPALLELDFDGLFRRELLPRGFPPDHPPGRFTSLALSPRGDRLYLLDEGAQRLWWTDRDGAVQGSADLSELDREGNPRERIFGRVDVSGDTVLVAVASDGEVLLFDHDLEPRGRAGEHGTARCQLGGPLAAALTGNGELIIVDHQRMKLLSWDPVANECRGEHFGIGWAPGYFYYPRDLALGPEGRLYVAQGAEGRVQVYAGLSGRPAP